MEFPISRAVPRGVTLAFGGATPRLIDKAKTIPGRGIYFDLVVYDAQIRKNQTPYTPAVQLLYALDEQLKRIEAAGGIEARWARHDAMRSRVERWAEEQGSALGVAFLPKARRRSWTVSCLKLLHPEPKGSEVSKAKKGKGFTIASGYGGLKETNFRIGHMGDHTVAELEAVLNALNEVLHRG